MTGAGGFLGRHVCGSLETSIGLARHAVSGTIPVTDYADYVPPPEAVLIHCAERRDVAAAAAAGEGHIHEMVGQLSRLLRHRWRHVVYVSSAVVYGDGHVHPRRANEAVCPSGIYARAKLACERLVLAAGGTIARLANLYGPGMAPNAVLSEILAQRQGAGELRIRDDRPVRDFLWVADAAAAIAALARAMPGGIFNVGSGRGVTIGELARAVLQACGRQDREIVVTSPANRDSNLVLDIAATTAAIGWRPSTSLEAGLARMLRSPA